MTGVLKFDAWGNAQALPRGLLHVDSIDAPPPGRQGQDRADLGRRSI
jgi:hypothetical protein